MSVLRHITNGVTEKPNLADVMRTCVACGVIAADEGSNIVSFNSTAEHLTGLKASDLLNRSLVHLPASIAQMMEETIRTGVAISGREVVLQHPSRGEVPIRVTAEPIQNLPNQGATAILNELPTTAVLETQIGQLDRLASLGTLSASMAHEIRNALVPVRTFLELLTEKAKGDELSDLVHKEINRVDFIAGQMLRFAGPRKPTLAQIHVHDILQLAVNLTRRHIEHKKITLATTLNAPFDQIEGDSYQLEAAFMNLLFNAAEATPPNGKLTVRTDLGALPDPANPDLPPRQAVCISFNDTGNGIPPETIDRIFEPFFTTKSDGTGLGLNITYHVINQHHGSVDVISQVGVGSTFTIRLPVIPGPTGGSGS